MKVIKYNGASYPAREIELDGYPTKVTVSVTLLEDALLDDDGNYKDDEAKRIDEMVYYYLTSEEFVKPKARIKELLNNI